MKSMNGIQNNEFDFTPQFICEFPLFIRNRRIQVFCFRVASFVISHINPFLKQEK